jgi:hypothetical protein
VCLASGTALTRRPSCSPQRLPSRRQSARTRRRWGPSTAFLGCARLAPGIVLKRGKSRFHQGLPSRRRLTRARRRWRAEALFQSCPSALPRRHRWCSRHPSANMVRFTGESRRGAPLAPVAPVEPHPAVTLVPGPAIPAAAAIAGAELDRLAEKVSRVIARRVAVERERRGR